MGRQAWLASAASLAHVIPGRSGTQHLLGLPERNARRAETSLQLCCYGGIARYGAGDV